MRIKKRIIIQHEMALKNDLYGQELLAFALV